MVFLTVRSGYCTGHHYLYHHYIKIITSVHKELHCCCVFTLSPTVTCKVSELAWRWKHYIAQISLPSHFCWTLKKIGIQLESRTFWLLVRHSYHLATGSLVAEECRIGVNILRIKFTPRQWLASLHKQLGIYNMQRMLYSNSASNSTFTLWYLGR